MRFVALRTLMVSTKIVLDGEMQIGPTGTPRTLWPSWPARSCRSKRPPRGTTESFSMKTIAICFTAATIITGIFAAAAELSDEGRMPDLDGAVAWLNSAPLRGKSLRGRVC